MTEIHKQEVRTFLVSLKCDCGGEMKRNGPVKLSDPPLYPHGCGECGEGSDERKTYPCVDYATTTDMAALHKRLRK